MEVMHKILQLLEDNKLDQKKLYDYIGVKAQVFSDWKAGRNKSYMKYLPQIADFFNVPVDYLLGKTEQKNSAPESEDALSAEFSALIESLTDEDAQKVLDYMRLLIAARKQ